MRFYFQSLFSGYGLIGISALCSIASVTVALRYVSAEGFGLWAVVAQLGGYFALADTGISSAVGRLLVDALAQKRPSLEYGRVFWGGFLLLTAIATALLLIAWAALPLFAWILDIPGERRSEFFFLAFWNLLFLCLALPVRTIGQSILAAGRYDLLHLCLAVAIIANLAALLTAFLMGAGIAAFVYALITGFIFSTIGQILVARNLGLLPARPEWTLPKGDEWRPMFGFARDVSCVQLGNTLVYSTQTLLFSATLGLEAAAAWATGSKLFFFMMQGVGKIGEVAAPGLSNLHAAGRQAEYRKIFHRVFTASILLALLGALALGFGNSWFVHAWTEGKISWPESGSWILAGWLLLASTTGVLTMRALSRKAMRPLRWVYVQEGVFAGVAAWFAAAHLGTIGVVGAFAAGCALFSFRKMLASYIGESLAAPSAPGKCG